MPLTALGGTAGTVVIGDTTTTVFPQTLHPNVMAYVAAQAGAGYAMTRTEIDAVNNLVWGLVGMGIWSKIKAIYPIIGTTAASHKWNLKDPIDTNAAFRLSFLGGGWTHSSTGATPNGTTSYADTFLVPSTSLSVSSGHLSFYSRNQVLLSTNVDIGASSTSGSNDISGLGIGRTGNQSLFVWGTQAGGTIALLSSSSSQGFFIGNQNANTGAGRNIYRNGAIGSVTTTYGTPTMPTLSICIGAANTNLGRQFWSSRQCSFASIGDGLSDLEAKAFSTIVQSFQTTLGRQV